MIGLSSLPIPSVPKLSVAKYGNFQPEERKIGRTADLSVIFPIAHAGSIQQTSKNHFDRRTGRPVRAQTLALLVLTVEEEIIFAT